MIHARFLNEGVSPSGSGTGWRTTYWCPLAQGGHSGCVATRTVAVHGRTRGGTLTSAQSREVTQAEVAGGQARMAVPFLASPCLVVTAPGGGKSELMLLHAFIWERGVTMR